MKSLTKINEKAKNVFIGCTWSPGEISRKAKRFTPSRENSAITFGSQQWLIFFRASKNPMPISSISKHEHCNYHGTIIRTNYGACVTWQDVKNRSNWSIVTMGKYFLIMVTPIIKYSAIFLSILATSQLISASSPDFKNLKRSLCDLIGTFDTTFNFSPKRHSNSCKLTSFLYTDKY